MRYITIPEDETIGRARTRILVDTNNKIDQYVPAGPPTLMFNGHKVLTLKKLGSYSIDFKVDGPAEIIEVLFKELLMKNGSAEDEFIRT